MTPTDPNSFDDPILREAVRRAWGGETAPSVLRERVAAMGIGAAKAPATAVMPAVVPARRGWAKVLRHPNSVYGMAAAAMVLIGFAIAARLGDDGPRQIGGGTDTTAADYDYVPAKPVLAIPVLKGVLDQHDSSRDHLTDDKFLKDVPPGDFNALRMRLSRELGFKALSAPLVDEEGAWTFRGASVCKVDKYPASHLVFERPGETISVFSLPRASCPDARIGLAYHIADADHPLVVFVRSDGVHFVVGSSDQRTLSPEDLRGICNRLRPFLGR
jgi:hypothetical protein